MFKKIDLKEKPSELEKRIRTYWEKSDIQNKSIDNRNGEKQFVFYEGPPTANGNPGIHHVISRAIKDSVCRYKTMQGFQVKRKAGWDTHGLPVEIEVEKKLGLKNKPDIEKYGIEKFCNECKNSVFTYEKEWQEMTKTMGYWVDLKNPYITLENNYIETVWWILNNFFQRGLIYKGHKIVPYCPSCGTPLSSHEVAQGYQDVEDPSVYVKFKQKNKENTYFMAWTTTPWTLISNVALVVNPNEKYVEIKQNNDFLILAKERLNVIDGEYEIIKEFTGKDLEYTEYEQLFNFVKPEEKAFYICCGDYVSMTDGTGIVHTAPAFGQDDYTIGVKYSLPFIQPVDDAGKFTDVVTDYKGQFVKDADKDIIRNLKERNILYKREQIKHNYPFCWRCKSPLIYYARSSWYIKTSDFKDKMIQNNKKINWQPSFVGEKRFGEWLENNVDWALSRDRFWGTPLNIWICDECGERLSIGSINELKEKGKTLNGESLPKQTDIELHRPYVDNIIVNCPKCNKDMHRTPEVIDCWFDSGSMPFSQWHYPFENNDIFETELFPADFICEGIDQTRGWFYTLLAISTLLKGESPYKNVLVNDLILDKYGHKMSKSKGNTVDPMQLMETYGADAIRWYLIHVSPPWTPTKFDVKGVEEVYSKFIGTLKNVYSFYITYAEIDNFEPKKYKINNANELDKWIYSRLHSLMELVIENNEKYDFTRSLRAIQKFVIDDLSNWYVRRSRRRYWVMTLTDDKIQAYLTLYNVLVDTAKLIAPFAPFIAEEIYTGLTGNESVHLEKYPVVDNAMKDKHLEKEMQTIIDIVTMGRAARNQAQIKIRQPLNALYIQDEHREVATRMMELIKEEINVKDILFLNKDNELVVWQAKLNLKIAGPKFGKDMKIITEQLEKENVNQILQSFTKNKSFTILQDYQLTEEDIFINISPKNGYTFENYGSFYVALDTTISNELLLEGHAREIVNKIQFSRKENNLNIMDRIVVTYHANEIIDEVMKIHNEYITTETLTDSIIIANNKTDDMKLWDINEIEFYLKIEKSS